MKYYNIRNSRNRKEVGVKPQSQSCLIGDIKQDFIPREGKIEVGFELPEPILENKAKQTSLIGVNAIPNNFLVIDDMLLDLFKNSNIGNYQAWKIKTWHRNALVEKYNLFTINDTKQKEYILFSKSEFYTKKLGDWKNTSPINPIFVKDFNEYTAKSDTFLADDLLLLSKKVIVDLSKAKEDCIRFRGVVPISYMVSEKLKNEIETKGFTGMEFTEISEIKGLEVIY